MEKTVAVGKKTIPITASPPSLWLVFWTFLKIGAFAFGGGFAMISLIEQEVVNRRRWIEPSDFLDCVSSVQLIPGAVATNIALFTGHSIRGIEGSLAAVTGVTLPSFLLICIVANAFTGFHNSQIVSSFFQGVRPVVVGLILATALRIGGQTLDAKWKWLAVIVGLALMFLLRVHPMVIVLLAAITGLLTKE